MKQSSLVRLSARLFAAFVSIVVLAGLFPLSVFAQPGARVSGNFVSVGPSATGYTYYVDAENGSDSNTGLSPDKAWQSLDKVTATTFLPGDHILLRASSVWNNQILYPKGDGSAGNPIVIDLYEMDGATAVYAADKRPVINGNGTKGVGTNEYVVSGAVMIYNQEYWEFRNLEVTNSEDLSNPNAYMERGDRQRCGILVFGDKQDWHVFNHIVIKDCYVHDVQTEHYKKPNSSAIGGLKATGGIIVLGHHMDINGKWVVPTTGSGAYALSTTGFNDVLIEGNVVKNVGLEGIRTKCNNGNTSASNTFNKTFTNVTIRNNYLENISGDGIVLTEVASGGLVESNIAKAPNCADYGNGDYYAGVWSMFADDALFQYNEVYGIRYGYGDGEAFDIDLSCLRNVYQYNYSHDNLGGFFLLMNTQEESVIRHNVSFNDGGVMRGSDPYGVTGGAYTFSQQSLIHCSVNNDNKHMPDFYNNTFYVGDGISASVFGKSSSSSSYAGMIARFYNNIVYNAGEGRVQFITNHPSSNSATGSSTVTERSLYSSTMTDPESLITNNIFYSENDPTAIVTSASGTTVEKLEATGNMFTDPGLLLNEGDAAANIAALLGQNDTAFDVNTGDVYAFTAFERIRERAGLFQVKAGAPGIGKGKVPTPPESILHTAETDFYGNSIEGLVPDIGAHQQGTSTYMTDIVVDEVSLRTPAGIYPSLPKQVRVTTTYTIAGDETKETAMMDVKWEVIPTEKLTQAGEIEVEGIITAIERPVKAMVTVYGNTGDGDSEEALTVKQDAMLQRENFSGSGDAFGTGSTAFGAPNAAGSISAAPNTAGDPSYKYPYAMALTGNNNTSYNLKVKNATQNGYQRRFLVQFDLDDLVGERDNIKNAYIRLHIARYDLNQYIGGGNSVNRENLLATSQAIDVYAFDENTYYDLPEFPGVWNPAWAEDTVTWVSAPMNELVSVYNHKGQTFTTASSGGTDGSLPTYEEVQPVAHNEVINADVIANGHIIDIDVSDYLRSLDTGVTSVNFLVDLAKSDLAGYSAGQSGFDAFSKEGAAAAYQYLQSNGPLTNGLGEAVSIESETALAPTLIVTDKFEVSFLLAGGNDIEVGLGEAPVLPGTATLTYSDDSTRELTINWESYDSALLNQPGSFTIIGYSSFTSLPVVVNVTVTGKTIKGFEALEAIDASNNTPKNRLGLPVTATAILEDESTVEVDIDFWDNGTPAYGLDSAPGSYTFAATVDIPTGYILGENVTLTQTVNIHPAPKAIRFDTDSKTVTAGESITFSATVDCGDYTADAWSSRILWSLTGADTTIAVDQSGVVTTTQDAVSDTYTLTATSMVDETVFATAEVMVQVAGTPADKTALEAAILAAGALQENDYTASSWATLRAALESAKEVQSQGDATQADVDTALASLQNAVDALVNITALRDLYNAHKDWTQGTFTDATWLGFTNALADAYAVLTNPDATGGELDTAQAALQAAIGALEEDPGVEVDISALQALYDEYAVKDPEVYTTASQTVLADALAAARQALDAPTNQMQVNNALAALRTAADSLVARGDKTALTALANGAKALTQSSYTANSWKALQAVLADADALLGDIDALQSPLDAMETALQTALDNLVDVSALRDAVVQAKGLKEEDHTPSTWKALSPAVTAAEAVLTAADATKAQVAVATANLETALAGLVKRADSTSLARLYAEAEKLEEGRYTAESWTNLATAMQAAKATLGDPEAPQLAVNDAYTTLRNAMNRLERKPAALLSGSSIKYTGTEAVEIKVDAEPGDLQAVRVSGTTLTQGLHYTLREGSVIVTLAPSYLQGLANGTYDIELVFSQNTVTVSLDISRGSGSGGGSGSSGSNAISATGDATMWTLYAVVLVLAAGAMVTMLAAKRRRSK